MLTFRFSGEPLRQLRKLLLHAADTYCTLTDDCRKCQVNAVCEDVFDIYTAALNSEVLCITVTREK